jgi:hypothetical protein
MLKTEVSKKRYNNNCRFDKGYSQNRWSLVGGCNCKSKNHHRMRILLPTRSFRTLALTVCFHNSHLRQRQVFKQECVQPWKRDFWTNG